MKLERRRKKRQAFDSWCMGMDIDSQGRCNFVSFRGIDISEDGLAVYSRCDYDLGKQFVLRLPNSLGEQLLQAKVVRKWYDEQGLCIGLKFCSMGPAKLNNQTSLSISAA